MSDRAPRAVTPIAFVGAIVLAYERYGRSPAEALAKAQIAPSLLKRNDARISAAQMEAVSAFAMQQLDDEALGWFSRRLPWGSYGMLARASISAPDLGLALKRWCRHHGLLTDDLVLTLEASGGRARLRIHERRAPSAGLREFCLVTLLRNVHGVACWLVDSRIPLDAVHFPFAAPPHAAVYPLLYPGPVNFDAAGAGFDFDARYLALPLKRDERALNQMLQRALPLTVLPYRRDRLQAQRVRQWLHAFPGQAHSAASVAAALNVSVRTLHRQLAEEGSSLQALKDEARREHAIALLTRSQRPVKQIAAAVGFASEKSFARAFREWTGRTPSALRRR
ncbi:AraC family transcriptional regulator [Aquincola sp. S2]|uniref:AraC family transcriptional regulator n=1 Tax=Pseudaquabacterium terrae TaxID=2732868 RepID=A0ABX2EAB6_9BURK|nr:AraC family transcriptional regulator [Aquabacterium terrae]NRF66021.1 AraC family transcriptional regulator [Aquabacterium terrae]